MKIRATDIPAVTARIGGLLLVVCFWASPAWGVQEHGDTEGMVAHQMGHVLFVIGMLYPLYHLHRNKQQEDGWCCFRGFLWTVCLWNIIAFFGHWFAYLVEPESFLKTSGAITGFKISSLTDLLFYLTSLEHLVLAPSLILLYMALRHWNRQT